MKKYALNEALRSSIQSKKKIPARKGRVLSLEFVFQEVSPSFHGRASLEFHLISPGLYVILLFYFSSLVSLIPLLQSRVIHSEKEI